jgi:hypothetical protein
MFHSRPFKKDITPFAKGGKVVKHIGKGGREQNRGFGGTESLTGADSLARMANNYSKPPQEAPAPSQPAPPVPMGSRGGGAPTAMMPPGEPDADDMV